MNDITNTRRRINEAMMTENRILDGGSFTGSAELEKEARDYIHGMGGDMFTGRAIIRFSEVIDYVNKQLGHKDNDDISLSLKPLHVTVTKSHDPSITYKIASKEGKMYVEMNGKRVPNSIQLAKMIADQE